MSSSQGGNLLRRQAKAWLRFSYRFGFPYIQKRTELPHILNARGLLGDGVEVGVQQGEFSEWILMHWKGRTLYSVDPWREFSKDVYQDTSNLPQAKQEDFYRETVDRLKPYGEHSRILRCLSEEAVAMFKDRQLDFVYIDAQHHYDAVKEDIGLWAPKIKPGGILAGHDYREGYVDGVLFGVKPAVDEFVREHRLRAVISREAGYPSWFIVMR